ncbi:MAG: putative rane lipoprotein [Burkholderiaceae bacterium]|nr:putative rane lipoprotein [Burkholderiaceae bacterium]
MLHPAMTPARLPLDGRAYGLLFACTMLWGLQQVAIKVALPSVSPLAQSAVRSALATVLLLGWAQWRGIRLFGRDGTLAAGIAAGVLFAGEFCFIYSGLAHTSASRMVVFVYLAPVLTALGLAIAVPGERLAPLQWAGVLLAFAGLVTAFADGLGAGDRGTLLGDAFGVVAAVLWAATTVLVRGSSLARVPAEKTLFYQLAVSALLLPLAAWLVGEPGIVRLDPLAVGSLLFQGVAVAFASYLAWFWLLTRYYAGRLAVFSFLAPLFGVVFGVWLLGERLSPTFAVAALMVGAGIGMVNFRR